MWSQSLPDTQKANADDIYSQENENPDVWGRLYSVRENIKSLDLVEEKYTVGRSNTCSVVITANEVRECVLTTISKTHFMITKTQDSKDAVEVYLHDLSSNGTYVNNEIIGKGKKRILKNNDQISLSSPRFKVFVYRYMGGWDDDQKYPDRIRCKYIVTSELGAGACGKVYLVFDKITCQRYAMKIIQKKKFDTLHGKQTTSAEKVMNEVKILKALKHPCTIRVEDIVDTPDAVYIVLELMEGGELFDRVKSSQQLREPEAKLLFYQIAQAVKYLHDNRITHRDLKPENILLASDKKETLVKVSDFGLSKFVTSQSMLKTFCGTPLYVAPEILETKGTGSYTQKVDIWSMGVILYICLSGYPPFSDEYLPMPLNEQIMRGAYSFHPKYWHNVSTEVIDLIKKMLTVDPTKRIGINEVLSHKWLKDRKMKTVYDRLIKDEVRKRNHDEDSLTDEDVSPVKHIKLDDEETRFT